MLGKAESIPGRYFSRYPEGLSVWSALAGRLCPWDPDGDGLDVESV